MTTLAPTLELFFTQRLITQRQASPHTVTAYRDTFRLLLSYVHPGRHAAGQGAARGPRRGPDQRISGPSRT